MTTETAAKRDTQKLQRAIVDGLEDVKAQDILVFDTEHLSSLFERVIVASGTSNRQTKALAASVRDAVREAGFPKPRIEGEANGEWIIVDCAQAVVHIMQPTFRAYYHLEELWGEKPVRLKFGASKPVTTPVTTKAPAGKTASRKATAGKKDVGKPVRKTAVARVGTSEPLASRPLASRPVASRPVASRPVAARKTPAKSPGSKASASKAATSKVPAVKPRARTKPPATAPARKTPLRTA